MCIRDRVLTEALKELFHADNAIKIIGIRHGEKMYETLLTDEECTSAIDLGNFYRVPVDTRDLNYDKFYTGSNEPVSYTPLDVYKRQPFFY